ncbi:hypothetical protein [Paraglaciecola sp. 20A4]|uniref:hypothetical protein n=1 Tax=Paraglaciecola sp. 20A4 TaxID=2687288 RepID=UPI001F0DD00E|nr:hypothetical protein [Paraglaciecola sp. 20A4]
MHNRIVKQQGAIMLVTVSLLLIIASLATVHTGRVKSLEHKILLNSQNQALAGAAAEGGLAHGISRMRAEPNWQGQVHTVMLNGNSRAVVHADFEQVQRNGVNVSWAEIQSMGFSSDELGSQSVREQVLRFPLLNIVPKAPLISSVPLSSAVTFLLGANPNGGGNGVPVSLWADEDIAPLGLNSRTCALQSFDENRCARDVYSNRSNAGDDVLQNHEQFPVDVLDYFFHIREFDWRLLKSEASIIEQDCGAATLGANRVIWIEGECALEVNQRIGSESTPVILILVDSALLMPSDSHIFGVVIQLSTTFPSVPKRIAMAVNSQLTGSLILLSPINESVSQFAIRYNKSVLDKLQQDADMQRLSRVSGSWRDF